MGSRTRRPGAHIAVERVTHRYRGATREALAGIDLEIQPCEIVALVGRSGCGKSTLIHIISGLTMPNAGTVYIDGARVKRPSPRWSVMFQQPHLYPWMSVEQNIGLGLKFAGRPRRERRERVGALLQLVELEGYGDRNVQDLSGGQQQRVALARSLALDPEVLLLDEPFSALDQVTRQALQRDVRRIALDIGITTVIVTHDIAEAALMSDRAVAMASDPGRIAEIVPLAFEPREPRQGPALQRAQARLQDAFERASGRALPAPTGPSPPDTLKIIAAGHH